MSDPYHFSEAAEAEADAAATWYKQRSFAAADRFLSVLEQTIETIRLNPLGGALYAEPYRYRLMRPFPYSVIFEFRDNAIEIVAVAHTSRRPVYWRSRR